MGKGKPNNSYSERFEYSHSSVSKFPIRLVYKDHRNEGVIIIYHLDVSLLIFEDALFQKVLKDSFYI